MRRIECGRVAAHQRVSGTAHRLVRAVRRDRGLRFRRELGEPGAGGVERRRRRSTRPRVMTPSCTSETHEHHGPRSARRRLSSPCCEGAPPSRGGRDRWRPSSIRRSGVSVESWPGRRAKKSSRPSYMPSCPSRWSTISSAGECRARQRLPVASVDCVVRPPCSAGSPTANGAPSPARYRASSSAIARVEVVDVEHDGLDDEPLVVDLHDPEALDLPLEAVAGSRRG